MKEYFEALTDSKSTAQFAEIVMMVVCAVIAGCDVWDDIADYCRVKEQWLRERMSFNSTCISRMNRIIGENAGILHSLLLPGACRKTINTIKYPRGLILKNAEGEHGINEKSRQPVEKRHKKGILP